ncbi:MAG: putative transporter [Rhodobacteraceae bacterium]|nr:MAG: putative transporter [Paracoccaceae bacterium]
MVEETAAFSEVALVVIALALAGAAGLALGKITVAGVGIGIGGVLFAGLAVGHVASALGVAFDAGALEFVREFGLILFVYTIGVQVGPGFFATLRSAGLTLNALAASLVALGVLMTIAVHLVVGIEAPALVGLMSGAVTNTPGLGAATQALKDVGADDAALAAPSLAYAVAYPFGIIGILLTMMLLRAALKIDVGAEAKAWDAANSTLGDALPTMNIAVRNPNFAGRPLADVPGLFDGDIVASRMLKDGELTVPARDTRMAPGDVLHLVGPAEKLNQMRLILGEQAPTQLTTTAGTSFAWERMAVTETRVLGKPLRNLAFDETEGVRVSRVTRAGTELVARGDLSLQFGDIVTAVGPKQGLAAVRRILGAQESRLREVNFTAVFVGIALGVLVGSIPIAAPGLPAPLKLGLAGGPLVVAILLARLGNLGPLVWFMPPTANHALRELGIVLFLAVVGIRAGDRFIETLVAGDGLLWLACGGAITLVPLLIVGFVGRMVYGVNYLSMCGLLAGSMTDPPALAFANGLSASPAPALAYATVYPLVMCLRILAPQVLVLTLL